MAIDWEWWRVKAALEKRGLTLVAVATGAGLAYHSAPVVKRMRFPAMQAAIAKAIGIDPEEIWPSRYDDAGRPVPDPARRKPKPPAEPAPEDSPETAAGHPDDRKAA